MIDPRGKPDNDSIPWDAAWDHVAKLLLPDEPVRKPTKRDAWLINRYRLSINPHYLDRYGPPKEFAPNALIAEVDRAYFRLSLLERVNQWFEDKGFDILQPTFPKRQFEAAVQADFGQLPPEPVKSIETGAAKAAERPSAPPRSDPPKRVSAKKWVIAEAIRLKKPIRFPRRKSSIKITLPNCSRGAWRKQRRPTRQFVPYSGNT